MLRASSQHPQTAPRASGSARLTRRTPQLPRHRAKVDNEICTLRRCKKKSIRRDVNRLPEQAAIGPNLLDLLMDRAPAFIEQHEAVDACVRSIEQPKPVLPRFNRQVWPD